MGYYDKERVRGFLHNQDGIIVNDFGEEVILRGWGMGNWDNPEGFMPVSYTHLTLPTT